MIFHLNQRRLKVTKLFHIAQAGNSESHGLSILDIAKHSVRTIAEVGIVIEILEFCVLCGYTDLSFYSFPDAVYFVLVYTLLH